MEDNLLQNEYKARINKAFDYIEQNIEKQFRLDELGEVANFSKYHFHRIFQACVGETPFQFINRVRLEKAASAITMRDELSISEIAHKCGFSDVSIFSRNFKSYFKKSPSEYRKKKDGSFSNLHKNLESEKPTTYFSMESNSIKWKTDVEFVKNAEIKELPAMTLAYVRHTGPYKGSGKLFQRLWNKLFTWAGPRGFLSGKDYKALIVYHDNPNITRENKLRSSVCITVPHNTKVDGEIGKMEFDRGLYMVTNFEIAIRDFEKAWFWVYGLLLPNSGYQPDDKPCFEMYREEQKNGIFRVEICVPVKPL
jgi:AraC family transcriptional regulator